MTFGMNTFFQVKYQLTDQQIPRIYLNIHWHPIQFLIFTACTWSFTTFLARNERCKSFHCIFIWQWKRQILRRTFGGYIAVYSFHGFRWRICTSRIWQEVGNSRLMTCIWHHNKLQLALFHDSNIFLTFIPLKGLWYTINE